jgi:hypothetical protein
MHICDLEVLFVVITAWGGHEYIKQHHGGYEQCGRLLTLLVLVVTPVANATAGQHAEYKRIGLGQLDSTYPWLKSREKKRVTLI